MVFSEHHKLILETMNERMLKAGVSPLAIRVFEHYYRELCAGVTGIVPEAAIAPVESVQTYASAKGLGDLGRASLSKLVMIKLNGGLGTSMGLERAKSLLPARPGRSFLDVIFDQVVQLRNCYGVTLPLMFLNSFRTEVDTMEALARRQDVGGVDQGLPFSILQSQVPKIVQDTLEPVLWPKDPTLEWCPPGHGDVYVSLCQSGLIDALLAKGYQYAFISNVDNLAATFDPGILGYLVKSGSGFLMEVARRTVADKKGGHVARSVDGGLVLRERAQTESADIAAFEDVDKHCYFNTNSLWIDLQQFKNVMDDRQGVLGLPLICNKKAVDPRDAQSTQVYQLETAMGAAISVFSNAEVLLVPRTRFAPVKTTNDLLNLWSDNYKDETDGTVCPVNLTGDAEIAGSLDVQLDGRYYSKVDDFAARFPHGAPSLKDCTSFKVQGDVSFGRGVVCHGDVVVTNASTVTAVVADGTVLSGAVSLGA
jgi:UTP--glucose-1-phosphate uridylyltransferase